MSEEQVAVRRPRRSSLAIQQLVEEFVQSGLRPSEFCRRHGVVLSTLNRYLRKRREAGSAGAGGALVAVELTGVRPTLRTGHEQCSGGRCRLGPQNRSWRRL